MSNKRVSEVFKLIKPGVRGRQRDTQDIPALAQKPRTRKTSRAIRIAALLQTDGLAVDSVGTANPEDSHAGTNSKAAIVSEDERTVQYSDRNGTEKRYKEAVEQLKNILAMNSTNFEIPNFEALGHSGSIKQLQEELARVLETTHVHENALKDMNLLSKSKRLVEKIVMAVTPFFTNTLQILKEGSSVCSPSTA